MEKMEMEQKRKNDIKAWRKNRRETIDGPATAKKYRYGGIRTKRIDQQVTTYIRN